MLTRRRSRPLVLLATVFLALALMPGSAVATSDPYSGPHSGNYGDHWLRDSAEFAGVKCFYSNIDVLQRMRIRPPIVQAFNRTHGSDRQTVGWKAQVEFSDNQTDWFPLSLSHIQKAAATDTQAANFTAIVVNLGTISHSAYRVRIMLRWYYPNATTIDGRADHWVHYYAYVFQTFSGTITDWCPSQLV